MRRFGVSRVSWVLGCEFGTDDSGCQSSGNRYGWVGVDGGAGL